ncbi:protease inhibitor I42 family protein [Arthrobacter sp. Z4-13]
MDVFAAIRKLGIWLTFQPLDNLLGATVRHGVGGMLITTERPLSIQRYTAAHELGHWVLHDDEYTWDTDATVIHGSYSLREHMAQVFGAAFLMPRQLVQTTLRRLGLERGGSVSPAIAYQASRDMGVSYEAALTQMMLLRIINESEYASLKSVTPISIKTELTGGRRPANANANVWVPDPNQLGGLNIGVGDEVVVVVPENRTTGYRWSIPNSVESVDFTLNRGDKAGGVELVQDDFTLGKASSAGEAVIGGQGRRRMILRANSPGEWALPLTLTRSFQPGSTPIDQITVGGRVQLDAARVQARINAGLDPDVLSPTPTGAADA